MKILGTKLFLHDSAYVYIDTDKQHCLAESVERITRIKHDWVDVLYALYHPHYSFQTSPTGIRDRIDFLANCFAGLGSDNQDQLLGLSLTIQTRAIREQHNPKYINNIDGLQISSNIPISNKLQDAKKLLDTSKFQSFTQIKTTIEEFLKIFDTRKQISNYINFDHHLCHCAGAYFFSPFFGTKALVVSLDGEGDHHFSKAYEFRDGLYYKEISRSPVYRSPTQPEIPALSLGNIYSSFTAHLGFRWGSDEGKTEALAAYGKPIPPLLDEMVSCIQFVDNSLHILPRGMKFVDQAYLSRLSHFEREDLAATVQEFLEIVAVKFIREINCDKSIDNLVLTGGVSANVIMNMKIFEDRRFKHIHVSPFMGDEGTAYGAAVLALDRHSTVNLNTDVDWLRPPLPYLGPQFTKDEVLTSITSSSRLNQSQFKVYRIDDIDVANQACAKMLSEKKLVALFQGRAEFGPRALGNRSILANPSDRSGSVHLNKYAPMDK